MKKGVVLIAIGHPAYGKFAWNMAVSIHATSGDLPVQVLHDDKALAHLSDEQLKAFDVRTKLKESDYLLDGKLFPAMAKLKMYDYLAFDENLYLDVDGVVMKDLRPIFTKERKFYESEVQAAKPLSVDNFGIQMQWALGSTIAKHYKLSEMDVMPFINSSFQFIRKGKQAKELYKQALKNLKNPIPPSDLHITWGKRLPQNQPDELYMDIACVQKQHDPSSSLLIVYFHIRTQVATNIAKVPHYVLGLYGGTHTNHRTVYQHYDRLMGKYISELYGAMHYYKSYDLMAKKFMTQ